METSLIEQMKNLIYRYNINKAYLYNANDIKSVGKSIYNDELKYDFLVNSPQKEKREFVKIGIKNQMLNSLYCTCQEFKATNSCEHIPAVILNNEEFLLPKSKQKQIIDKSHKILEHFSKKRANKIIKKELHIDYNFVLYNTYWDKIWILKIKIGEQKLYTVGPKYNKFINCYYDQEGIVEFGKYFIYNPNQYYFSESDNKILDFLHDNCDYKNGNIYINDKDLRRFLKLFKNKIFYIQNIGQIDGINDEMPIQMQLTKENDNYVFDVNITNDLIPLTKNLEYILYQKKAYHLNPEYRKLLTVLIEDEIQTLIFKPEDLSIFSEGILPIVKKDLKINDELSELKFAITPDVKLYFDINKNNINCKIKLIYDNKEIDYFSQEKEILRDVDYEIKILQDLYKYNFKVSGAKIILDSLEEIVYFMEKGLNDLANKYQVFTSEKLKQTNIRKKFNITSSFSIGKDNILRYDFDLGDINSEEINNIINSMRQKNKYYKLKNGDIINLEDNSLQELNSLVDELELDISSTNKEIPKYRAIYLDSIKKSKYNIIKTNNLFDEFIEKFNKYKNARIQFTKEEEKILRNYQKTGVEWLYNIHKCDLGGILADEMGLGKSIQTIYFFKKLLEEDCKSKFLIVCPTALVYNWLNEFKKFARHINVEILIGNKTKRQEKFKNKNINVYITSYGTLREDTNMYDNTNFKVCIIDEAQNIKNPLAKTTKEVKKIKAKTKIALTGTPIENSVTELWSIFDFIMPGFLSNLIKFNEKYKFKELDEEATNQIENLNKIVTPFVLRRKKKDVLKDLPDKIENNIFIDLGKEQKKLYAAEIKRVEEQMNTILENENFSKAKFYILQLLTRLRQLCIDPKLIFDDYKEESTKIENLVKIVKEIVGNGHKILLFTSFKSALEIVRDKFSENNISYYVIDGSVKARMRQELVDRFNNDKTNVFLITLKSGGTGLNLTSADVVIHLDLWWNPQAENQATDRAHRIGQKKTVEVIKLIARGTIEERILELQKKKKMLSDKLIDSESDKNIKLFTLTEKDIKELLTFENLD